MDAEIGEGGSGAAGDPRTDQSVIFEALFGDAVVIYGLFGRTQQRDIGGDDQFARQGACQSASTVSKTALVRNPSGMPLAINFNRRNSV